MPKRSPNPRLAKTHRNYTVAEIAALYNIHKNTVLAWRKAGLRPIDDRRKPILFLGAVLSAFLDSRRAERKRPLLPGQIYCVRCHAAKEPALGMVEYLPMTATSGNLCGLCPTCEKLIYRRVARARLGVILGQLEVTLTDAAPRRSRRNQRLSPKMDCARLNQATRAGSLCEKGRRRTQQGR